MAKPPALGKGAWGPPEGTPSPLEWRYCQYSMGGWLGNERSLFPPSPSPQSVELNLDIAVGCGGDCVGPLPPHFLGLGWNGTVVYKTLVVNIAFPSLIFDFTPNFLLHRLYFKFGLPLLSEAAQRWSNESLAKQGRQAERRWVSPASRSALASCLCRQPACCK